MSLINAHTRLLILQRIKRHNEMKDLKAMANCPGTVSYLKFRNEKQNYREVLKFHCLRFHFRSKIKGIQNSKIRRDIWMEEILDAFLPPSKAVQ